MATCAHPCQWSSDWEIPRLARPILGPILRKFKDEEFEYTVHGQHTTTESIIPEGREESPSKGARELPPHLPFLEATKYEQTSQASPRRSAQPSTCTLIPAPLHSHNQVCFQPRRLRDSLANQPSSSPQPRCCLSPARRLLCL